MKSRVQRIIEMFGINKPAPQQPVIRVWQVADCNEVNDLADLLEKCHKSGNSVNDIVIAYDFSLKEIPIVPGSVDIIIPDDTDQEVKLNDDGIVTQVSYRPCVRKVVCNYPFDKATETRSVDGCCRDHQTGERLCGEPKGATQS